MKAIKTKIVAASLAALTCASFTVVPNRDEELRRVSGKYAIVSDECFDTFLKNLKSINAIIFIPDSKVTAGKGLNLQAVQTKDDSVNLTDNYIRVVPFVEATNTCSSKNKVNFDNLGMVVFVEKKHSDDLAKYIMARDKKKYTGDFQNIGSKYFKIGTKLNNILIDGSSTILTQVEFKL